METISKLKSMLLLICKRVFKFISHVRGYFMLILAIVLFLLVVLNVLKLTLNGKSHLKSEITYSVIQSKSPSSLSLKLKSLFKVPNEKRTNEKILCYILLDDGKLHVAKIISETWGKHCDKLVFFGSDSVHGNNLSVIPLLSEGTGYQFLWGKTKAALLHLSRHYAQGFDWFMKADLDTFVIVENLRKFIMKRDLPRAKPLWFGFKMRHRKMQHGYMSGGAGYVMNSKAIKDFAKLVESNGNRDYVKMDSGILRGCKTVENRGIEDLELGRCFHAMGMEDVSTTDDLGRQRFLPLSLSSMMGGDIHSSHWIWEQSWNKFIPGKACCSQNLISIHEIPPSQQRILYFLLYQLKRN